MGGQHEPQLGGRRASPPAPAAVVAARLQRADRVAQRPGPRRGRLARSRARRRRTRSLSSARLTQLEPAGQRAHEHLRLGDRVSPATSSASSSAAASLAGRARGRARRSGRAARAPPSPSPARTTSARTRQAAPRRRRTSAGRRIMRAGASSTAHSLAARESAPDGPAGASSRAYLRRASLGNTSRPIDVLLRHDPSLALEQLDSLLFGWLEQRADTVRRGAADATRHRRRGRDRAWCSTSRRSARAGTSACACRPADTGNWAVLRVDGPSLTGRGPRRRHRAVSLPGRQLILCSVAPSTGRARTASVRGGRSAPSARSGRGSAGCPGRPTARGC